MSNMAKERIAAIKALAKNRENRRLPDGEYARLMAKATAKLALKDGPEDLPIVERRDVSTITLHKQPARNISEIKRKHIGSFTSPERASWAKAKVVLSDLVSKIEKIFTSYSCDDSKVSLNSKYNRRLTEKQYRSLMKRTNKELGLEEKGNIGVLDLNHDEDCFDLDCLLRSISYTHKEVVKEFETIVKRKRISKFSDHLAILNYLLNKSSYNKPMCLLPEKEKINVVREQLSDGANGLHRFLKPRGDIKIRPFRVIPDEEYFLEIKGRPRKKEDAFDKMSDDKKIQWARYANLITKMESDNIELIKSHLKSEVDRDVALFAMKYACKMMGMQDFKGWAKNAYWILYRIIRYHTEMTSRERGLFCKMAVKSVDITKTIPIIDRQAAIERLKPTLKKHGLYKEFVSESRKEWPYRDSLEVAKKLLLNKQ